MSLKDKTLELLKKLKPNSYENTLLNEIQSPSFSNIFTNPNSKSIEDYYLSDQQRFQNVLEKMRQLDPERLARLESQGFDTSKIYLHGTSVPFQEFDPNKSMGSFGPGIYFTDSPNTASHYTKYYQDAQHGRTIPVFLKKGEYLDASTPGIPHIDRQKYADSLINVLQNAPEKNRFLSDLSNDMTIEGGERVFRNMAENTSPYNSLAELWDQAYNKNTKLLGQEASKQGIPGFKAEFRADNNPASAILETYKIVPDDANIKSIWAKGKGPGFIGGTAAAAIMGRSSEADASPLPILNKLVGAYRNAQQQASDFIVEHVNPYPKQKPDESTKDIGRMAFDPVNLIGGPVGDMLTGIDIMHTFTKKEDDNDRFKKP